MFCRVRSPFGLGFTIDKLFVCARAWQQEGFDFISGPAGLPRVRPNFRHPFRVQGDACARSFNAPDV